MKISFVVTMLFCSSLAYSQSAKEAYLESIEPKVLTDQDIKDAVLTNFRDIIVDLKNRNILNDRAEVSDPLVEVSSDLSAFKEPIKSEATHMVTIYFYSERQRVRSVCKFQAPFKGIRLVRSLSERQLFSFLSCNRVK